MNKFPIIEFHILQSFPVSCLNRDDTNSPKTCVIGGIERARVSSQCWKRSVRLALRDFDIKLGMRTKKVAEGIEKSLKDKGFAEEAAIKVLPAYAGMFPRVCASCASLERSPRVCGDVSATRLGWVDEVAFSPRMRGCFLAQRQRSLHVLVLPAYAGMFRAALAQTAEVIRSPRVCGDVSLNRLIRSRALPFSPRMRGCFFRRSALSRRSKVLPAYAGMFPRPLSAQGRTARSPRVCGDVSIKI